MKAAPCRVKIVHMYALTAVQIVICHNTLKQMDYSGCNAVEGPRLASRVGLLELMFPFQNNFCNYQVLYSSRYCSAAVIDVFIQPADCATVALASSFSWQPLYFIAKREIFIFNVQLVRPISCAPISFNETCFVFFLLAQFDAVRFIEIGFYAWF